MSTSLTCGRTARGSAGSSITASAATPPRSLSLIHIFAPSLPPVEELQQAIAVLCNSLKLAALEKMGL